MPTSVTGLFRAVGLATRGPLRFGDVPAKETEELACAGVYVLSRSPDPHMAAMGCSGPPLIALTAVEMWLETCPKLSIDGRDATSEQLAARLAGFWPPEEPVVYIGKADCSIYQRLSAIRSHKIGTPNPHRGGQWLKALADLDSLAVFWSLVESGVPPGEVERKMLRCFVSNVACETRDKLHDPKCPIPWANLEYFTESRQRIRKDHGLSNHVRPRARRTKTAP